MIEAKKVLDDVINFHLAIQKAKLKRKLIRKSKLLMEKTGNIVEIPEKDFDRIFK